MSSALVSAAAAQGRLFFSGDNASPEMPLPPSKSGAEIPTPKLMDPGLTDPRLASVTAASRLAVRQAPEMLTSGIAAINSLTGGWPRGCLTEICGPASSGRTTVLLAALAAATRRGEFCVLVDASDALDPCSAADAGVDLDRLLWVRCGESSLRSSPQRGTEKNFPRVNHNSQNQKWEGNSENRIGSRNSKRQAEHRLEQVLHATDLLLESGGFGLVVLDLSDLPQQARRIPLTTWFRFRRAIEHTPTVLLAMAQHPIAGSCSSLLLQLGSPEHLDRDDTDFAAGDRATCITENALHVPQPTHAHLLTGLDITAKLICSRLERKPARAVTFATKTAWAG